MVQALQPFLLGAMVHANILNESELGQIAMSESLAFAIGCAIAPSMLDWGWPRLQVLCATIVLASLNILTVTLHGALEIAMLRGIAGIAEGVMLGEIIIIVVRSNTPDRLNALLLGVSAVPQAIGAYVLPVYILPRSGVVGAYVDLTILTLLSACAIFFVTLPTVLVPQATKKRTHWSPCIVIGLIALLLQNAAVGGAWNYIEQLGSTHHFTERDIGIAGAGCLVLQVVGALLTAWIGWRLPYRVMLVVGGCAQAAVILALGVSSTAAMFIVSALAFGFLWLAMGAFQMKLLIEIDSSLRAATLLTAITMLGLSLGPGLSAFGVSPGSVAGAYTIAASTMGASVLAYLIAISLAPSDKSVRT
jgi:DHA1 family inner membrane transport protein